MKNIISINTKLHFTKSILSDITINIIILFLIFIFNCCSVISQQETESRSTNTPKNKNTKLTYIINQALYNVDNINIYQDPDTYLDKIISTKGTYVEQKWLKDKDKKFIVSGSNNGYAAEYLIYLDHPLPQKKNYAENFSYISPGAEIRVFGRFLRIEDYMSGNGTVRKLPVLDALAIFKQEDREMLYPVWTNSLFQDIK